MRTTLIFARHGQTEDNAVRRLSTAPPGPGLNSTGRQQAKKLANHLADRPLTAIYASPLDRARQTAEYVATMHGLTIQLEDGLRELSVGELEGQTGDAVFDHYNQILDAWTVRGELDTPVGPGGETGASIIARSVGTARRIAAANSGGTILVVAHACVLYLLLTELCLNLGMDDESLGWLRNCQTVEVVTNEHDFVCLSWAGVHRPLQGPPVR